MLNSSRVGVMARFVMVFGFLAGTSAASAQVAPPSERPARPIHPALPGAHVAPEGPTSAEVLRATQDQVIANLRAQPLGLATAESLNMPEEFLRRVASRIIRQSFAQSFRRVEPTPEPKGFGAGSATEQSSIVQSRRREITADRLAMWRGFPVQPPEVRSFRAPVNTPVEELIPLRVDDAKYTDAERTAAEHIAKRLAFDGLMPTLVRALALLTPDQWQSPTPVQMRRLSAMGLPTDLLQGVALPGNETPSTTDIVAWAAAKLKSGISAEDAAREAAALEYRFRATQQGFVAASETGEYGVDLVRAHINTDRMIGGVGGGGAMDLLRQVFPLLPQAKFIVHVRQEHAEMFAALVGSWAIGDPSRVLLSVENMPIAQWAQDNGKPGFIQREGVARERATIMPRYTGRGEAPLSFMAGESQAMESLSELGERVIQSRLIFEGGNLIPVRDPASGKRFLFVGEAEIARNAALGLSREQVLGAFAAEFGADRVVVLPAASFHIDFEVTFRAHDGKLLAFVNDSRAALRHILTAAGDAFEKSGTITPEDADKLRTVISDLRFDIAVSALSQVVSSGLTPGNAVSADLIRRLSPSDDTWAADSMRRLLLALDMVSASYDDAHATDQDARGRAYFAALVEQERDRFAIRQRMIELGFTVVMVPSLSADGLSLNYLNGVHAPGVYLMPAYGGVFARLDSAARETIQTAIGTGATVYPVFSAETMHREGAVHCAISLYPSAP